MDGHAPSRSAGDTAQHNQGETKGSADRVIEIDWTRYDALLKDVQIDDEQKQEFIEALWSILVCLWGAGYSTPPATQSDDEQ